MILTPGTRLGSYEIISPLGAGGMGEVYRARDHRLERDVAIKVLPEQFASNAEALMRFEREAKAVAALSHPNILSIHDIGDNQGVHYAVMELLEGETLRQRLRQAALPWRKAAEIGAGIADALTSSHAKGIVHRDLKPENIFLTADGVVKVLDFGIAQVARRDTAPQPAAAAEDAETQLVHTTPGVVVGTMGYMSPEQLQGSPVDGRSDIFSLGCLLYEMASGQKAFSRKSPAESITAVLKENPPELSASGRQVPTDFDRIIGHCLEKRPGERFQSARDLAFALRTISSTTGVFRAEPRPKFRPRIPTWMIGVVALVFAVLVVWLWTQRAHAPHSIAVLPFVNVGADPSMEYLSDGITESIINDLAQLPDLAVMSRSSVYRYKRPDVDPLAAARDLKVDAVLTGRVTHRGEQLFVSAELVDARTNRQIWGEQYNRNLTDVMGIQQEISREISGKLSVRLSGEDKTRLGKRPTENSEAYGLYLKGRYEWNKQTLDGMQAGIDFFQEAIKKDQHYTLAYAGLADAYALLADYNVLAGKEVMPRAKTAAMKALELDDTISEAHASLGWAKMTLDWDWPGAEREFKRALELNPNYATAHQWYADYLTSLGRAEEARAGMKRAQELEPASLPIHVALAATLYYARQNDLAIEQCRRAILMDPQFIEAHVFLARALEQKGSYSEALAELKQARQLSQDDSNELAALGQAYARSGDRAEAQKILNELTQRSANTYVQPMWIAAIHAALGNKDEAVTWLRQAVGDRSVWLIYLKVDPFFDGLRSDPRFIDLVRQAGLP